MNNYPPGMQPGDEDLKAYPIAWVDAWCEFGHYNCIEAFVVDADKPIYEHIEKPTCLHCDSTNIGFDDPDVKYP